MWRPLYENFKNLTTFIREMLAMAESVITEVTMSTIKESQPLYPARSIDELLKREKDAAVARENQLRALIKEQDDTFDDMCQALANVSALDEIEDQIYTENQLQERVNVLTRCLKSLYTALLGE